MEDIQIIDETTDEGFSYVFESLRGLNSLRHLSLNFHIEGSIMRFFYEMIRYIEIEMGDSMLQNLGKALLFFKVSVIVTTER